MTRWFTELPAGEQQKIAEPPYDRWLTPAGDIVAEFRRIGDGFMVRFPGRADFSLSGTELQVACAPAPGVSRQFIIDLFHNQVAPLLRNREGDLVLHASAVATPVGALGFVGHSGRGKSTLAARLALVGCPFITDDGLSLAPASDGYLSSPERPYLRLWSDSDAALFDHEAGEDEEKTLIDAGPNLPHQTEPAPLRFLYLMGDAKVAQTEIVPLSPPRALSELIRYAFILDVDDRPRLQAHFERLADVAERVPCFALDYPRRYEDLPRVTEAILDHATNGVGA